MPVTPTLPELTRALAYIEGEWFGVFVHGQSYTITSAMWTEGLEFARTRPRSYADALEDSLLLGMARVAAAQLAARAAVR